MLKYHIWISEHLCSHFYSANTILKHDEKHLFVFLITARKTAAHTQA